VVLLRPLGAAEPCDTRFTSMACPWDSCRVGGRASVSRHTFYYVYRTPGDASNGVLARRRALDAVKGSGTAA
jgi:hypothetical protein